MLPQLCPGGGRKKHPFLLGSLREHPATLGDAGISDHWLTDAWFQKERHLATEADVVRRLLLKRKRVLSPWSKIFVGKTHF